MGQNNAKDDREGRINAAIDNLEVRYVIFDECVHVYLL